jgi:L-asparagine permease
VLADARERIGHTGPYPTVANPPVRPRSPEKHPE